MNVILRCEATRKHESGQELAELIPVDEGYTHGVNKVIVDAQNGNFKPGKEYNVKIDYWPANETEKGEGPSEPTKNS